MSPGSYRTQPSHLQKWSPDAFDQQYEIFRLANDFLLLQSPQTKEKHVPETMSASGAAHSAI